MCGTCSRKKRTNLFKRQTIQRLTKFLTIPFFMHFLKQNLGLDFLDKILPFTESLVFQLITSIMTALSNPFTCELPNDISRVLAIIKCSSVMIRLNWSFSCVHTTRLINCKYAGISGD